MVSKVRYRSFKEIDLRRRVRWVIVLVMALVFFVVAGYAQEVGLLLSFAYLLSGLLPRLRPAGRQEPRPAPAGGRDGRPGGLPVPPARARASVRCHDPACRG